MVRGPSVLLFSQQGSVFNESSLCRVSKKKMHPHGSLNSHRDDGQVLWGWLDTGPGARDIDVATSEVQALSCTMATLAVKKARFLKRRLAQRRLWFQREAISFRFANLGEAATTTAQDVATEVSQGARTATITRCQNTGALEARHAALRCALEAIGPSARLPRPSSTVMPR